MLWKLIKLAPTGKFLQVLFWDCENMNLMQSSQSILKNNVYWILCLIFVTFYICHETQIKFVNSWQSTIFLYGGHDLPTLKFRGCESEREMESVDWSGNPDICFRPLLSVFPMRNLFLINIFWEQIICSRVWLNLTRLVAHFFQSQSHFPILCQKSETFLQFWIWIWIWNRKESYAWKNYCQSLSWSSYKA